VAIAQEIQYQGLNDDTCSECGSSLVKTNQSLTCSECGLVNELLYESQYIIGLNDKYDFACGSANQFVALAKRSGAVSDLGTHIGFFYEPFPGKLGRLKRQNIRTKLNDSYRYPMRALREMVRAFMLPVNVQERAGYLYKKIVKSRVHIENRMTCMLACLYVAIRERKYPLRIDELITVFQDHGHRVNKRLVVQTILKHGKILRGRTLAMKPVDYIQKALSNLARDPEIKKKCDQSSIQSIARLAREIVTYCQERIQANPRPYSLLAASIYAANRLVLKKKGIKPLSQKMMGTALKIPEYTLRDTYNNHVKPFLLEIGKPMGFIHTKKKKKEVNEIMETETEEVEEKFKCDYPGCPSSFEKESSLIAHKRWHSRKRKSKDAKAPSKPVENNPSPPNAPTFQATSASVMETGSRNNQSLVVNPRGSGDGKGVDLDNQESKDAKAPSKPQLHPSDAEAPSKPVENNPSPPNAQAFHEITDTGNETPMAGVPDVEGCAAGDLERSGDGKGVDLDNQEFEGDIDDVLDFIRGRALVHFNWSIENGTKNMNFAFARDEPSA